MKNFIITIDTEGDNLWNWKAGEEIKTENTSYLQRFQDLCNRYGFKPTWLTNYEMINDPQYVEFIGRVEEEKTGELGMHLHAWNNPPLYELPLEQNGAPYLIEYPAEIMEEKIVYLTNIIRERTGITPVSHRAGRWAMNDRYFQLLDKYGYRVDCSVTPGINWNSSAGQTLGACGSDYSRAATKPYVVEGTSLLEVPVNVLKSHKAFTTSGAGIKERMREIYHAMRGQFLWLRPNGSNLRQMVYLLKKVELSKADYVMFMLHSSELMPGGSPTFATKEDIEKLYQDLDCLFARATEGFQGVCLRDYAREYCKNGG